MSGLNRNECPDNAGLGVRFAPEYATNLDHWERFIRNEFECAQRATVKKRWRFWEKPSQISSWLDLISWDGYKRENAVMALTGAAPNSFFLALAIRRLNDWVPQVRAEARKKLPIIVNQSDSKDTAEALCVTLSSWNSWGRIEQSDKNVLLDIMSQPEIANALKNKIISSSSGPMTYLMSQIGQTPALDNFFNEISETAIQPSVRAKAYRYQFEDRVMWLEGRKFEWTDKRYCQGKVIPVLGERQLEETSSFKELLERSATDASSIVRRVAAEFLIRELDNLGDQSTRLANLFISDKSPAVSERGKFALRKLEETQGS